MASPEAQKLNKDGITMHKENRGINTHVLIKKKMMETFEEKGW